ncbi:hypothetical protein CPB84DRAFT_1725737 [Gymnopilus junonius]|uniref:Metal homeostatis protein bsd2 n=1 Tax=Gymnopilus junonius TaxID=109634 RepID=A0A9P5TRI6_GYMJU|nr:hypothetical protein CPB84DRAFT_1725737 [Gymnopilus junonius]
MPGRYAPLPNPRSAPDAEREMEDAFDLNDEHEEHADHETAPLTNSNGIHSSRSEHMPGVETTAIPGVYDFEREYDFPPPGSPPRPSSRALPNDFGNSNGLLPTAPVVVPKPRQSFFRRAVGAILPTHYQRVPTENHPTRPTGGGIENDGVFANVTAKPQPGRVITTEDGDVHVVPEDSQKESPPTYLEAQADAVPPYWETTIHAPMGMEAGDMIIDDLPAGSFLVFCLNIFISFFFQFVGFLLTYLLHTSHAAKFGSRAGLGLTLIQYGFYSRTMSFADDSQPESDTGSGVGWGGPPPATPSGDGHATAPTASQDDIVSSTSRDWLSFLFMTLGWFLLLSSVIGFWRVKRWERTIRAPASPPSTDEVQRDVNVRRGLEEAFGLSFAPPPGQQARDEHGNPVEPYELDDARLARNLRNAGFL